MRTWARASESLSSPASPLGLHDVGHGVVFGEAEQAAAGEQKGYRPVRAVGELLESPFGDFADVVQVAQGVCRCGPLEPIACELPVLSGTVDGGPLESGLAWEAAGLVQPVFGLRPLALAPQGAGQPELGPGVAWCELDGGEELALGQAVALGFEVELTLELEEGSVRFAQDGLAAPGCLVSLLVSAEVAEDFGEVEMGRGVVGVGLKVVLQADEVVGGVLTGEGPGEVRPVWVVRPHGICFDLLVVVSLGRNAPAQRFQCCR